MDRYPNPVSIENTKRILMQMEKSVFCIYRNDGSKGTGFFCFISLKDKRFPVMITNNHVIDEKILKNEKEIHISLNNGKKIEHIKFEENMAMYTNEKYDITIIEINPIKYNIEYCDFLEIEFKENNIEYNRESIYLIQYVKGESAYVSYGQIKSCDDEDSYKIRYLAQTDYGASGAPIINLRTQKIVGVHTYNSHKYNFCNGTILKFPIIEFMNKYKDYLSSRSLQENHNNINIDKRKNQKEEKKNILNTDLSLEKELKEEKDKNKKLGEKIEQYESLINELLNKSNKDLNVNELMQGILKKDKEIEILKQKLSRFPFELSEGEELYSLIFTSGDQKIHHSIICKNTSKFSFIESQLYDEYPDYSETNNLFTVCGNKINRNKSLKDNKIKNNDIIVLNVIDY